MKKQFIFLFLAAILACMQDVSGATNRKEGDAKYFNRKYIVQTMNKVAEWQIAHPKHRQYDWTNGAFYAGMYAAWETTKSKKIYDAMMAMARDSNRWQPGRRWYHADDHVICQTYMDLYRTAKNKKPEMLQPTRDTLEKFISNPYPVRGIEVVKWWWCDALFMGPPALVKFGITVGDKRFLEHNDKYYRECYDLLYNREEHLFARDLGYVIKGNNADRYEANGKRIFWSRGNGWVLGGLVRLLKELPADYPERPFYVQLYKEMCARVAELQQEDGLWRASLLDPDSYPGGEVSGSGFFCYAIAWGINEGVLEAGAYRPVAEKAWIALNKCVNEEGRTGWVQPIGADPRRNFSAESWEVYGTGAFLLAGSEIVKMKF
jgi:rhamnogalacturonyl hydrolase YesR